MKNIEEYEEVRKMVEKEKNVRDRTNRFFSSLGSLKKKEKKIHWLRH